MSEPWCEQTTNINDGGSVEGGGGGGGGGGSGASVNGGLCYSSPVGNNDASSTIQQIGQQTPNNIPPPYEDTSTILKNTNSMVHNPIVGGNINFLTNCFYSQQAHSMNLYTDHHQQESCASMKDVEYPPADVYDMYNCADTGKYDNYPRWNESHSFGQSFAPRIWPKFSRRINQITPRDTTIKVTLENKTLIERFDKYCTEMIITKTGRRMFPSPQVSIQGLESSTKYFVLFDIVPADDNRYKFHHFNWVIAGKSEPLPPSRLYIHPESPLTGSQWMKQQITFQKVKLTNNTCDQNGHIILNSMHRYQPRIHVVAACDIYSVQFQQFNTYAFPECQFIAVTAYQNSQVTQLKIEHNPFAKGFRKQEKEKRARQDSEGSSEDHAKNKNGNTAGTSKNEDKDLKRSYPGEPKCYGDGPDRKIGYFDLSLNRWSYGDSAFVNQSGYGNYGDTRSQNMIGYCPSQSKYDHRQSFYLNSNNNNNNNNDNCDTNNNNNNFDKNPYQGYGQPKYGDAAFSICEPLRPFPYSSEFPSQEYRANGPSFI